MNAEPPVAGCAHDINRLTGLQGRELTNTFARQRSLSPTHSIKMSAPQIQDDIKLDTIEHAEQPASATQVPTTPHAVATVSPLQSYGLVKTITSFKYATALCLLAGFNACSDGFQNGIPGSVVACVSRADFNSLVLTVTLSRWRGSVRTHQC
jgi:hypothetical protein